MTSTFKSRARLALALLLSLVLLTGCTNLEKSKNPDIKTADFVTVRDPNGEYPVDYTDFISFKIFCGTNTSYTLCREAQNTLETKIDGKWYVVPRKDPGWRADMPPYVTRNKDFKVSPFRLSEYDYEFKQGEYRYILNIEDPGGKRCPIVYYFKLV